jgi:hypothetical protein
MTENHLTSLLKLPSSNTQVGNAVDHTSNLNVQGSSIKLDDLGPMVVNSDGVSVKYLFNLESHYIIGHHRHRTCFVLRANGNTVFGCQTLSRIANWSNMTEVEQARTLPCAFS